MTMQISRREAIASLGALGLGALASACSSGNGAVPQPTPSSIPTGTRAPVATTAPTASRTSTPTSAPSATRAGEATSSPTASPTPTLAETSTPTPSNTPDVPASCTLTAEQTEGPFFVDTGLLRRDITEGREGLPLRLRLRLVDIDGCTPIRDAVVEAWHADADGVYSGFDRADGNLADTAGETFLRGYQITDADGRVEFETIYPGWYPGRTVHIHIMVVFGSTHPLTTQVYFDDAVSDLVLSDAPYGDRGPRQTTNANDGVGAGEIVSLTLALTEEDSAYAGAFLFAVARP